MKNYLIKVEYDGSAFAGWQRQPGIKTVQGELESALSKVCGADVKINGTSRTDAGVHALAQCASFEGEFGIPTDRIALAANNQLAGGKSKVFEIPDVRILSCEEVPSDFHARFSCKGKTYRYIIKNSEDIDIFRKNYIYQVTEKLDVEAMKEAATHIVGMHDFKCFQSAGGEEKETTVRTISSLEIETEDGQIIIEVTGDGFLYNMVRIIVGTLVEVGLGKRTPESLTSTISSLDRQTAGHTAPAGGLYLKEIYF